MNPWSLGSSVAVTVLLIVWLFACNPRRAARVDDCLDGGGSYDYTADVCDFEENHPSEGNGRGRAGSQGRVVVEP